MVTYSLVVRLESITKTPSTSRNRLGRPFESHLFVTKDFFRVPVGLEKGTVPHFRNRLLARDLLLLLSSRSLCWRLS
jgi:hypothetical protein